MPDDPNFPDAGDATAAPSPFVVPPTEAPMTNPEAAVSQGNKFRQQHLGAMADRSKEIDNLFSKQQLTVDNMSKILDDTANALKTAHDPSQRTNLSLVALGAGMMGPGNFGTQLGRGLQGMSQQIEKDRSEDDDYQFKLAQLAMRRAGVESAPIEQKIAYMRALQTGDQTAARAIELGMIKAQGQTGKGQNQADQNEIKANYNAMQAAQKQIDSLGKDYFSTPQQRQEAWAQRYSTLARSLGVTEDKIKAAIASNAASSFDETKVKGGFTVPGSTPEDAAQAQKLGLPPMQTASSYASMTSPADRAKLYPAEKAAFDKENKLVTADADQAATELRGLEQAEAILKAHPEATGPAMAGMLPNSTLDYIPGKRSDENRQSLKSIFANNTIHSVPKGQGAISDYERSLFNTANPSMEHNASTNLALIAQRKRLLQDQISKQAFYNNYFNHYKTSSGADQAWIQYAKSDEGRAGVVDEKGKMINNPNRLGWQDYFRKQWGDGNAPAAHARGGQFKGGGKVPGFASGASVKGLGHILDQTPTEMVGDPNFYRTLAQGAVPFADEATARVRSVLPDGPDYDTALAQERQGVKDFGEKYGDTANALTQLGGAALSIPLTMGAGAALKGTQLGGKAAQLASKAVPSVLDRIPLIKSALAGAGIGGAAGFGAGEGGFDNRLENAKDMAVMGGAIGTGGHMAVRSIQSLGNMFRKDNRVANFLRNQLAGERGDQYAGMNLPKTADGSVDVSHPNFGNAAADELDAALAKQRGLSMRPNGSDVLTADVLPQMSEAVMLHGGPQTANLRRSIVKRQFDPNLPIADQAPESQYGQVRNWFDRLFGSDDFRTKEADLLSKRSTEAEAAYAGPYRQHVWTPEIEAAHDKAAIYRPDVIAQAEKNAAAQGRPTGTFGVAGGPREGERLNYNMQYLHDVKRLLDKPLGPNMTFDKAPLMDVKNELNDAMGNASSGYKAANKQYGDTSEHIDALRAGREGVFGKTVNELDKGIGREDIDAFMKDPNKSQTEKDLYRVGAARALESHLLGSDAKDFGANWANVLNKPNMIQKYQALADPTKLGSWDLIQGQLRQLSDRKTAMTGIFGNSKTAARQQMLEDLNQPNVLAQLAATGMNPHAPSVAKNWVQMMVGKSQMGKQTANAAAELLNRRGTAGNISSVQDIRDILNRFGDRGQAYNTKTRVIPRSAAYIAGNRQLMPASPLPDDQQ